MQKVSNAYKKSMKSQLRERAYILISFGLVNQEAQARARIDSGVFNYYSNKNNVFSQKDDSVIYATLEQDFTKTDGSMFFPPRQAAGMSYYDTGIISRDLVSDGVYELLINLHIVATDFKGLTVNFGENYPVDFDLVSDSGQTIEYRGNDKAVWSTEDVLYNTTTVKFVFRTMKSPQSRLRIYSIRFGYGLTYSNKDVMGSTLESYISPIGADVPQIDFSVKLQNYDRYFDVDNPNSAINFLETGQEMTVNYGYTIADTNEIEWVKGYRLFCSEWESDDFTATIKCQDIYRNMDNEYYRGLYRPNGISYYDLAVLVLQDAGETGYKIDPRLKSLYTKNPIPKVQHKEALQIIANACRCVLSQTREGTILIKSNFNPERSITCNGETSYSNVANVLKDTVKDEYGTMATNYTGTDGRMFLIGHDLKSTINTGYISSEQSDANGTFTTNPKLTITQEAACTYYGVRITFGNALPAHFYIRTYNNGDLVTEYTSDNDEITQDMIINYDFDDFDKMEIEFTKTAEPYNRIVVNYITMGDVTEFTMERRDMKSSPKAIKQELIKDVTVPCYIYQNGDNEENLVSQDVDITAGSVATYYIGEPSYGFVVTLDDKPDGVSIVESGSYFVTISYSVSGKHKLAVKGYRYKIVTREAVVELHARGKSIKWENPLMSDMEMAQDLANWLGDYYKSGIEYEYDYRGNPEIDANDIIYQENNFRDNMKINVYRHTLEFNQSLSGKVIARRQGV